MSFAKNIYIYLFSNILNAAIPFLLLPLLTRYLSPNEYGQIAMFQTMLTGLGAFIGLNTVGAANRKFYDDKINGNDIRVFNGACIQILAFTFIATFCLMFFVDGYLSKFLSIPENWLYIALLISTCTFVINFRLGQWQVRKDAIKYGLLQVSNGLLNMSLTLILVFLFSHGAEGRVEALLYAGMIAFFVGITLLYKDNLISVFQFNKKYLKEALYFGIPLLPHVLGAFLLTAVDRFVINDRLGLGAAGIYMVAVQISMALMIVFDAINKAYVPWLFERLQKNKDEEKFKIVKNTYYYFVFVIGVAGLSFYIGPVVISLVVGDQYSSASSVIGWLCLGQVFGGMYLMVTNYIFYAKKTGMLSFVTIFSGILNLVFMIFLVNDYGIQGVAIAFAFSKLVQFLLTWWLASKAIPMPWGLQFSAK